jgi:hypothetical protein
MGGTAVLIRGTADVERLGRRGVLGSLFGGGGPSEVDLGGNRKLVELPSRNVRALVPAFKSYVRRTAGSPWSATTSILNYLDIAFNLYVRGERDGASPPAWYVQLSFGGCAGMAETSSEVAAHWATKWCLDELEQIAALVKPGGFVPSRVDGATDGPTFLPVGDLGYASFQRNGYSGDAETPATHFAIDAASIEGNEESAEDLLRVLERGWVRYMAGGRCHCQLCDPGFDHAVLADLPLDLGAV